MHIDPQALRRWVAAGLISEEQAASLERFEAEHAALHAAQRASTPPAAPAVPAADVPAQARAARQPPAAHTAGDHRSTTGAEALGYVGGALALGAIGLLVSNVWADLLVWARLAILGVLTAALGAAGLSLRTRPVASLRRLTSVLLVATVIGIAWITATIGNDVAGWSDETVVTVASGLSLVAAIAAYVLHQRALPQLAVLVALMVLAVSATAHATLMPQPIWIGTLVAAVGVGWLLAALGGWLQPRIIADIAGSVLVLIGAQIAAIDPRNAATVAIGVAVAAVLIIIAVRADLLHLLIVGALGVFVTLPQLVFEIFGDVVSAPAVLLIVGLLLVLAAVGLGRAREHIVADRQQHTGGQASVDRPSAEATDPSSQGEGQ